MAEAHDLVRTLATDFLPNPALPDGEVDRIIQLHTYPVDGGVEANAIRVAIDYCRSASAKFPRGFPEFTTRMLERVGELEAMSFAADANDDKFLLKGLTQAMEVALPLGVGFTPQLGIHIDGERRLLRLRPYIANTGSPPDNVGEFLSEEGGITDDPAAAADLRGPQGEKGDKGDKGDDGQDATVSANVLEYSTSLPDTVTEHEYVLVGDTIYRGVEANTVTADILVSVSGEDEGYAPTYGRAYGSYPWMNAVIYAGGVLTLRIISHSNPGAITNLNIFGTRVAVGRFQRTTWETAGGATNRYEYRSGAINNPFPQGITRGTVSVTATSPITYWHAEGVAFTPADNSKLDAIPDQTAGNAGRFIGFDTRGQYAALPAPAGGGGNGGGLSETQVDGRVRALVSDWAEHDNAQVIPDAKFPASIARDSEVPSQAFIDGRVRAGTQSWARADPAPLIPDNRIPSSIARDSEIPTTADIDARVVAGTLDWAQTGNNNDIPEDKIPGEIARDSEIPTNAQIDARADARVAAGVEDWAEAGNTSVIPRNKVPEQGLSDAEEALLDIFIPNTPNQWQHPPVAGGVGLASAEWATKPNEATITAVNYNRAAFTTTVAPNGRWLGVYLIQGYNDNPSGYSLLVGSTRILGESWERIASGTVGSNTVTFYTAQVPADAGEASGVAVRVEELQYRVVHSAGGRSRLVIPGGATETGTFTQAAADARYQRKSEKLDDVENAFNTGGWADSGIAGVAVGSVGQLVLDPSPKDLSRVSGMMYSATPNDVSPRFTNRYIYFRLPASATGEEDKWRIRYGTTDNMVTNRIPASGSLDGVLYMGTVLGRRYYRRQINDLPVGWRIRVQELDPYELNTDYVNTDDIFPTPPAGALEYDLTLQNGVRSWKLRHHGLQSLIAGTTVGRFLPNPVNDYASTLTSAGLKVSGTGARRGAVVTDVEWSFTNSSDANFGFTASTASGRAGDATAHQSDLTLASAVGAAAVYAAGGDPEGVKILEQSLYSATAKVGELHVYLVRDNTGDMNIYWVQDGDEGVGSRTVTVSARFTVSFIESDTGEAASSGGGGGTENIYDSGTISPAVRNHTFTPTRLLSSGDDNKLLVVTAITAPSASGSVDVSSASANAGIVRATLSQNTGMEGAEVSLFHANAGGTQYLVGSGSAAQREWKSRVRLDLIG